MAIKEYTVKAISPRVEGIPKSEYDSLEVKYTKLLNNTSSEVDFKESTNSKNIPPYKFYNFTSLESVGDTYYENIGDSAFKGCTSLKNINLSAYCVIGESVFDGCTDLTINIGGLIEYPKTYAFRNVKSFGSGYVYVETGGYASVFANSGIRNVDVRDVIGVSYFEGCSDLRNVYVRNCNEVRAYGFRNCESLTNESVNRILNIVSSLGEQCFKNCTSLTNITIGTNVSNINNNVFDGCSNLTTVRYAGTVSQWNSIYKYNWKGSAPFTTVSCSDGNIIL